MRAKLFTHAATLQGMFGGNTVEAARAWLARTYAARMAQETVRRFRKAVDYAGAAKRADEFATKAKALETENERLRTALQAYHRAAYLTLTQSSGVLDNRVRVDGKWHDLENRLPWYRTAVDELDAVYTRGRQVIGEPGFASDSKVPATAGAARQRAGTADLRIAA
jgi:hypothetical protein